MANKAAATKEVMYVQTIIAKLHVYWAERGCAVLQPLDLPVGAGTFHPATVLRALGPEPWNATYVQPSRRPNDGRYGRHPNRLQRYYQLQVVQKPVPNNFQQDYLDSLTVLGIDNSKHDIRFVEDDWESPTLGAWGLGWEVWIDGMEVTQFTYFQEVGGISCKPVMGEITYGIERLAMYLQDCDNVYDLQWNKNLSYGELHQNDEKEQSAYNYKGSDTKKLVEHLENCQSMCKELLATATPQIIPAYEQLIYSSHTFNLLEARRHYSVDDRVKAIRLIRNLAKLVAASFVKQRDELGHPLLKKSCR